MNETKNVLVAVPSNEIGKSRFPQREVNVFGSEISPEVVYELAEYNKFTGSKLINKLLFAFTTFCERTAVLCSEYNNYYNTLIDNINEHNDFIMSSIYEDDDIKCKYLFKHTSSGGYEISCKVDSIIPPLVKGRFHTNPAIDINGINCIYVPENILIEMINIAIVKLSNTINTYNFNTMPVREINDEPLKYLPMLWEKGINIEFYGDWLLAVTCSSCGDDLIIRSIDDFFNKHFGELDGDYTLENFLRELEVKSSVPFVLDTDILHQFSDRDLKNIGAIISHINGCGTKLSIRISSTDYNFIYTINGTDYDSVYKAKEYINNEYGFLNIMCPEYITVMCVIFENIGVAEFLKNINKEANNQLKYLPALCEQGIDVTFYGNWLLGFTNPTNGDEVVIYSIDDFFNEHFGKLNSDHGLKEFVDELKDSTVPFMSDEYIIYNFDRIDLNNIGDIISHINGLGVGIDAYTVKNKNDDGYHIVYDINTNEGDIYETIEYISTEYGFNKDDIHPEYIAAMYVIFYDIGVGKFLTKIGYEPKAE